MAPHGWFVGCQKCTLCRIGGESKLCVVQSSSSHQQTSSSPTAETSMHICSSLSPESYIRMSEWELISRLTGSHQMSGRSVIIQLILWVSETRPLWHFLAHVGSGEDLGSIFLFLSYKRKEKVGKYEWEILQRESVLSRTSWWAHTGSLCRRLRHYTLGHHSLVCAD